MAALIILITLTLAGATGASDSTRLVDYIQMVRDVCTNSEQCSELVDNVGNTAEMMVSRATAMLSTAVNELTSKFDCIKVKMTANCDDEQAKALQATADTAANKALQAARLVLLYAKNLVGDNNSDDDMLRYSLMRIYAIHMANRANTEIIAAAECVCKDKVDHAYKLFETALMMINGTPEYMHMAE